MSSHLVFFLYKMGHSTVDHTEYSVQNTENSAKCTLNSERITLNSGQCRALLPASCTFSRPPAAWSLQPAACSMKPAGWVCTLCTSLQCTAMQSILVLCMQCSTVQWSGIMQPNYFLVKYVFISGSKNVRLRKRFFFFQLSAKYNILQFNVVWHNIVQRNVYNSTVHYGVI